jgi:hypothetical protein
MWYTCIYRKRYLDLEMYCFLSSSEPGSPVQYSSDYEKGKKYVFPGPTTSTEPQSPTISPGDKSKHLILALQQKHRPMSSETFWKMTISEKWQNDEGWALPWGDFSLFCLDSMRSTITAKSSQLCGDKVSLSDRPWMMCELTVNCVLT